jgi:hypothetical protein
MARDSRALAIVVAGALVVSQFVPRAIAHDRITTRVSWDREIAPIVAARCAGCHAAGGPSTIALTTYKEARPWAAAIKEEVLTRRMPKWNAARGYGDFANDPSLSPFEIALVAAWVDGGAPENDKGPGVRSASIAATPHAAPAAIVNRTGTRKTMLACTDQPVAGRLLAVSPRLEKGASAGISARLPDGRQEIVAWIRDYDPGFPTTYWLRRPLILPRGSRLAVESRGACTIDATFAR